MAIRFEVLALDRHGLALERRGVGARTTARRQRERQNRLTAVGPRLAQRFERHVQPFGSLHGAYRAAIAMPYAAAMPIAGAPRTTRSRIACATLLPSRSATSFLMRQLALVEQLESAASPFQRADFVCNSGWSCPLVQESKAGRRLEAGGVKFRGAVAVRGFQS